MKQPLGITYSQKDIAKQNKCTFDKASKKWYVGEDHEQYESIVNQYGIVYLNVPYEEKERAKSLDCAWDTQTNKWFTSKCRVPLMDQSWVC
jgi:hypothetical protein